MSRGGLPDTEGMTSLKVDNLTFRTTQEDLKRAFTKYGDVGDVYIPRDRFSKESRGFAFVRFYDKHDAEDAMESMDGYVLDGRELRVQMARYGRPADPNRRSGGRDDRRDSGRRYGGGGSGGGRSGGGGGSRRRSRSRSRSPRSRRGRQETPRSRSRSNSRRRQRSPSKSRSPKYVSKSHSQSPMRELSPPQRDTSPRRSRSRSKSN